MSPRKPFPSVLILLGAIVLGMLLPQLHILSGLVRWLVMVMLFLVFLQTRISRQSFRLSHVWILLANLAMGFAGWGFGWLVGGRDVALAAFFAGITPTATAAPVVVSFLRGQVDYVVTAFFLTNLTIAALLPGLLPLVLGRVSLADFLHVLGSMALVMFIPAAAASLLRQMCPAAGEWPKRLRGLSLSLWGGALLIITANASHFLRSQAALPRELLLKIAVVSAIVCAANFALGKLIGGATHGRESSQALGQKNTTFSIYLAMTYGSPLIALGPTCYVLWHNIWNSWQLHQANRSEAQAKPKS
jgi:BASS family bile acid:Na+ symporter